MHLWYHALTHYGLIGTHDVEAVTVDEFQVSVSYFAGSLAEGALLNFVLTYINGVNFSFLLPIGKNSSFNYLLPFSLIPGQYIVFTYDIEQDGLLSRGIGYPAVTNLLQASGSSQGM